MRLPNYHNWLLCCTHTVHVLYIVTNKSFERVYSTLFLLSQVADTQSVIIFIKSSSLRIFKNLSFLVAFQVLPSCSYCTVQRFFHKKKNVTWPQLWLSRDVIQTFYLFWLRLRIRSKGSHAVDKASNEEMLLSSSLSSFNRTLFARRGGCNEKKWKRFLKINFAILIRIANEKE